MLVALAWPNHVFHRPARRWFDDHSAAGWATTPVTELGFVRISSNKKVIPLATTPTDALDVLDKLCRLPGHEFWPDDARLLVAPFGLARLGSYRQVTDVHLGALANGRGGTLATFDRGVAEALPPDDRAVVQQIALE